MKHSIVELNSLIISIEEFETITWNTLCLDSLKTREYMPPNTYNEEYVLKLIQHASQHCDPVFKIKRWTSEIYNGKKTQDRSMFWLRVLLNDNVSTIFPSQLDNPEFLHMVRKISPPIYSKLCKNLQNF